MLPMQKVSGLIFTPPGKTDNDSQKTISSSRPTLDLVVGLP